LPPNISATVYNRSKLNLRNDNSEISPSLEMSPTSEYDNKKQMAMCFAPRTYEIKEAIAELWSARQLPLRHTGYKPNYEGIKRIYAINAAKLWRREKEKRKKNEADRDVNTGAASNVNNANIMPPVDLVSNLYIDMLKEIIMCDYNYVDYNPKTDDDLLALATSVKSRKKVTRLLTKGIEQQNADRVVLDESKMHLLYNPDDEEEEREERGKVALERIELETKGMIWSRLEMDKIMEQDQKEMEEWEETRRQLNDPFQFC
jgi:hypothetical protein